MDDGTDLSQRLVLTIPEANYDLDFYVNWSLELGFKSPVSSVISDISIPIGTSPSWTSNLLNSSGGSVTIPGPSIPQSSTSSETSDNANGPIGLAVFTYVAITTIIIRRIK